MHWGRGIHWEDFARDVYPAGQVLHVAAPLAEKWFNPHAVQDEAPAAEWKPAGQGVQVSS